MRASVRQAVLAETAVTVRRVRGGGSEHGSAVATQFIGDAIPARSPHGWKEELDCSSTTLIDEVMTSMPTWLTASSDAGNFDHLRRRDRRRE